MIWHYGDFKDLAKRTIADKVLRDRAFKIASDQKYDGYQRGLTSMTNFLIKSHKEAFVLCPLLCKLLIIKKIYN